RICDFRNDDCGNSICVPVRVDSIGQQNLIHRHNPNRSNDDAPADSGDTSLMTVCTRCIMDTTDPDIRFDDEGVCNHCHRYDLVSRTRLIPVEKRDERLKALIDEIKAVGNGKPYDCVIGVSGGVDSTYVAWLVKKMGLRPLAVHLDNGWNSELAVANIEKTL